MERIIYTIDGHDVSDFGLIVKESTGMLDRPKTKNPTSYDWKEYNGKIVDTDNLRFDERTLTIKGTIVADDNVQLMSYISGLYNILASSGLHMLRIDIPDVNTMCYMVYIKDSISITKKWRQRDETIAASITIKLTEPEPEKKIIKCAAQQGTLSFTLQAASCVNLYYSDGNKSLDLISASGATITHQWSNPNVTEFLVITGNINDVNVRNLVNAETIWNRLL